MSQQELRWATTNIARRCKHAFEHGRHGIGIHIGTVESIGAKAVSLLLVLARKAQAAVHGGRLGHRHGGHTGIATHSSGENKPY